MFPKRHGKFGWHVLLANSGERNETSFLLVAQLTS